MSFKHKFLSFLLLSLLLFTPRAGADEASCEILVVGGGSAGISAALFAGNAGADVILVEATHVLGGNTTSGGVAFPGLFHAWGKQVIAGPTWDLICECVKLNDGALPDFSRGGSARHWELQVKINGPLFALMAEETLQKAGVKIRYYEAPTSLKKTASGWDVTTAAMGEIRTIHARRVIDCTGSASVAALVGAQRMREETTQPGTFNYRIKHEIPVQKLTPEQKAEIVQKYNAAMKDGTLQPGDARWGILASLEDASRNYVYGADGSTAEKRTETNLRGRQAALRMLRFIRTLPGGETAKLVEFSPEVGVRETFRVVGDYVITLDDYTSGKRWDDSLCFAFYPVDLHVNETGVQPKQLTEGTVPTIPLRAQIPTGLDDLLVAGRCVSSDRLANSGLRVQGACIASGQTAAAAAIVSVRTSKPLRELDLTAVKKVLTDGGAIVP